MREELAYRVALSRVPQIGSVHAKILVEHYGSATKLFQASMKDLVALEGIGTIRAKAIKAFNDFEAVFQIIRRATDEQQQIIFLTDPGYPRKLFHCYDPPTILFKKGNADLNPLRILAVIGSRRNTEYGRRVTEELIAVLSKYQVTIVSGLAYGIDAWAHKYAIQHNIATVAVVAHGLNSIYPPEHSSLAKKMLEKGAIISEYPNGTDPDKHNFPIRNRIVAGMCEAVVVIETALKGGSMITASLANGYNRDVFAVPGKWGDSNSSGCNELIRTQQAQLITNPEDVPSTLGWNKKNLPVVQQRSIFPDLSDAEKNFLLFLETKDTVHLDEWQYRSGMSSSALASLLLGLEMKGLIQSLPGKRFSIR